MKDSAGPKQPKGWFLFLIFAVPCLWGLVFWLQDWPLGVIAACMTLYLGVDVWNLVKIKLAAQKDPKS
jgi:hypothetical protein